MPGIYDYLFQQPTGSMLQVQPPLDPNAMMGMAAGNQAPQLGGQYIVDLLANGPRAGASVPQDVVPGMNNLQWYQDFIQQDADQRNAFNSAFATPGTIRRPSADTESIPRVKYTDI